MKARRNHMAVTAASMVATVLAPASRCEFVLVDDDTSIPPAPIVLFEGAPPRKRDAAVTLADYIQKTTGRRPQLIETAPPKLLARAIWVGVQPALAEAFPTLDIEFEHPEEILIAANDNHLVIAGRDRWDPDHMNGWGRLAEITGLELAGGHAFGDWWEKYHEDHPDYFALQPDGTRAGFHEPNYVKLCDSNPAVWDQWLTEVGEQLEENPTQRVFNASPNDGWDFGHCVCDRCRAWDHPDGEIVTYRWKGVVEERPAISDRHTTFANTLARLLKKRYPGREVFVQLHAYGLSRPPPVAAVPDDNVIISSVSNFHMRGDGVGDARTKSMQQFAGWARKAPRIAWRPNLGNPAGLQWGMPDVAMRQAGDDFRFVADNGCIGVFFDMLWGHWITQGPHYYAVAHLAWDPHTDVQALMDDYYRRGFGPAAESIKAYWTLVEDTRMAFVSEVRNRHRVFGIPQKYTPEWFARAEELLDEAETKLRDAPEKYRERIDFVRHGLDYTRLIVDTRRWMQKVEKTRGRDIDALEGVTNNWESIGRMKEALPGFAVNWVYIVNPGSKRLTGLHLGAPLSGRVKRQAEMEAVE